MENHLLIILGVLIVLAFMDLIVGVGNDAVNFLNSAIGSKVASFRTILIVASIGIMVGALSSAGMMEIARKAVFNPEYFTLMDVMTIFLAVMISDVLLLDLFNTFGMPTSTTVSIIFEILGATLVVAGYKVLKDNSPMNYLFNINNSSDNIIGYLNWSKTSEIVSSIFLSILISFTVGFLVMYVSRLLFSFNYKKKLKFGLIIWSSLALLSMSYFLVFKGMKSTYSVQDITISDMIRYQKMIHPNKTNIVEKDTMYIMGSNGENIEFIKKDISKDNTKKEIMYEAFFGSKSIKNALNSVKNDIPLFLLVMFGIWVIVLSILEYFKISSLKVVVFFGTFSLAMAFAGNDLVNFIGVPLAGIQSYSLFQEVASLSSGTLLPSNFYMFGLKFPIQTPYIYLLIAGMVMCITIWTSKKSRTVTETEVKLGSQEEINEKFKSNLLSRWIVKASIGLGNILDKVMPKSLSRAIDNQFIPLEMEIEDQPAFDLIRASVNLTIASLLIAMATNLKLPLSTTYVSFMVAMGASLADRAWGRESASYRVAGVFNVILGWFGTALTACMFGAIVALVLISFDMGGLIFMIILLIGSVVYSTYQHKIKSSISENNKSKIIDSSSSKISSSIDEVIKCYKSSINALINEDNKESKSSIKQYNKLNEYYSDTKTNMFKLLKKNKTSTNNDSKVFILSNDYMQDMLQSLQKVVDSVSNHIINGHSPIKEVQRETLLSIMNEIEVFVKSVGSHLKHSNFEDLSKIHNQKLRIFDLVDKAMESQVGGIIKNEYGFKNTDIYLSILLESKDIVAISERLPILYDRVQNGVSPLIGDY